MSHNVLSVEIEHSRYKALLDNQNRVDGSVRLTTIQPRQHRAVISVYHERQGKRSPITDFEFIPPRGTSEEFPDLRLEGSWTGRNRAHLRLFYNGRLYAERDVRLPGLSPLLVAIPLIVLVLLGGLWIMWPSSSPDAELRGRTGARETPAQSAEPAPARTVTPRADTTPAPRPAPTATPAAPPTAPPPAEPSDTATPPTTPAAPSAPATTPTTPGAPSDTAAPEIAEPREYQLVVYFRADSARITELAAQELREFAARLPDSPATQTRISGHAALAGPPAGRLPLSRQRAEAVSAALLTAGVEFGSDVQVRGYGAELPLTRNPELQDNNRRVEVELTYPPSNRR